MGTVGLKMTIFPDWVKWLKRREKMKVSRLSIAKVVEACLELEIKQAVVYLSPVSIVKATGRHKKTKNENHVEILLSIGRPNFDERKFIKDCIKAKEPFPVKKMQLKYWPKKVK